MTENTRPRPRRRWLRFSLRTLLIVVTLLCVVLGTWVSRSVRQRNALAKLELDLSSSYQYHYETEEEFDKNHGELPWPQWLVDQLGIDFLENAVEADVSELDEARLLVLQDLPGLKKLAVGLGTQLTDVELSRLRQLPRLTDVELSRLRQLPRLTDITLSSDSISNAGLANLESLTHLEKLEIQADDLSDEGLAHVGRITSLRRFHYYEMKDWTNQGVAQLGGLRKLEELWLSFGDKVTDDVLEQLQPLTNLQNLQLTYSHEASHAGLRFLKPFTRLEELYLNEGPAGGALEEIAALPALEKLHFDFNYLSSDSWAQLAKFPQLEELSLSGPIQINDAFAAALARLSRLSVLRIRTYQCELTDEGVKALSRLKSLKKLELTGCEGITDESLLYLAELKQLESLTLITGTRDQLSAAARAKLSSALPNCVFRYNNSVAGGASF